MDGIQKSRNDLLMEVHHLRSTANESITNAAANALDWDQHIDTQQQQQQQRLGQSSGHHNHGSTRGNPPNGTSSVFGALSYPSSGPTGH